MVTVLLKMECKVVINEFQDEDLSVHINNIYYQVAVAKVTLLASFH